MIQLDGFIVEALVYEGNSFLIYKGKREKNKENVLIRTYADSSAMLWHYIALKQNHSLSNQLDSEYVLPSLNYLVKGEQIFEILANDGSVPLPVYLESNLHKKVDYQEVVSLLYSISEAFLSIHQCQLLHLGINPSIIFIHPESKKIKLTGFIQSYFAYNIPENDGALHAIEEMFHYISPEQTGRINKTINQRSDLYSLGMTYYEILAGRKPFPGLAVSELIHSHIASHPEELTAIKPDIPPMLVDAIAKLTNKEQDARYQSAHGLSRDLKLILASEGEKFVLGSKDVSDQFNISNKIYGRQEKLEHITKLVENYGGNSFESLLVSGTEGIGKSLFVKEIKSLVSDRKGQILSYKCNLQKKNIPMSVIAGALQAMLDILFTLPTAEIELWKKRIEEAIGNQGAQLVSLIPAIEKLVDTNEKLPKATLQEEEDRFVKVLTELLRTFTSNYHSVVMIIENLEYCDESSALLLRSIFSSTEPLNILFIGTVNSDNVDGQSWLDEFSKEGDNEYKHSIQLNSLTSGDVGNLLTDSLGHSNKDVSALADILRDKSGGIPKYLINLLGTIRADNLLNYDYQLNDWQWDVKAISEVPEPRDVADLLIRRIDGLTENCRQLLATAACIGSQFNHETLAKVGGDDRLGVIQHMSEAEDAGLIKSIGTVTPVENKGVLSGKLHYEFTVYNVHQTIYNNVPENLKAENHLQAARTLLDTEGSNGSDVFEIANHLHLGFHLITVAGDNSDFLEVLRRAGVRAKSIMSYGLAFTYLNHAKNLTTASNWLADYSSLHRLLLDLVETAFLADKTDQANALFEEALEISRSNYDRAKLFEVKVRVQVHLSDLPGSFESGNLGLKYLGASLPAKPGKLSVGIEIAKSMFLLRNRSFNSILELPEIDDPEAVITLNIYYLLLSFAQEYPELYSLIALRMMQLTLKKGIHQSSFSGFTVYGSILSIGFGKIDRGFQFMEFAEKIAQKSHSLSAEAGALFGLGMQGIYKKPLSKCIAYFNESFRLADLSGSKFYASTSTNHLMIYNFLIGDQLPALKLKISDYLDYSDKSNEKATGLMLRSANTVVEALGLNTLEAREAKMQEFGSQDEMIPILWTWHYILRQAYHYLLGDYEEARRCAQKVEDKLESTSFHLMYHYYQLFRTLTIGQIYEDLSDKEQKIELKKAQRTLKKLDKLRKYSTNIFQHLYLFQLAIIQKMNKDLNSTVSSLLLAVDAIEEGEYSFQKAIFFELIGEFSIQLRDRERSAKSIQQAYELFAEWGAKAKTEQLLTKYPIELKDLVKREDNYGEPNFKWSMTQSSMGNQGAYNFNTVVDSLQSISKEIELDKVLSMLITVAMKYAGAQAGFISMYDNNKLSLKISAQIHGTELQILEQVHTKKLNYPTSVLNYVQQTQKTLLIDDASKNEQFGSDPYIIENSPKSILCMAIGKSELLGLMYFENNLTSGAFTEDKLKLLNLLADQAGISLQNARLYEDLINLNIAYQRFVPLEFLNLLEKSSITDLELGSGINREMTILFSDIRGFTSMSEQMSPKEAFDFLNKYLGVMEPIIKRNKGFIDKFMGDGIMALFPGEADDAIKCCLEIIVQLDNFNKDREIPVNIGMGLNTGNLLLGTVGGKNRMDSTVISDAVNVASRLEQLTKEFKVKLLVSEATISKLTNPSQFKITKVDTVEAIGRKETVTVYTVE